MCIFVALSDTIWYDLAWQTLGKNYEKHNDYFWLDENNDLGERDLRTEGGGRKKGRKRVWCGSSIFLTNSGYLNGRLLLCPIDIGLTSRGSMATTMHPGQSFCLQSYRENTYLPFFDSHPQTSRIQRAIFTLISALFTSHLCSNISLGVGLSGAITVKLSSQLTWDSGF